MSDDLLMFNTSQVQRQIADVDKGLDRLVDKVEKLSKAGDQDMKMFNSPQVRRNVASLEDSLETLQASVKKLNASSLSQLQSELTKIGNVGGAGMLNSVKSMQKQLNDLKKVADDTGKSFGRVTGFKDLKANLDREVTGMVGKLKMFHMERMLLEQKATQASVENAMNEARQLNRAFSDISTGRNNMLQAQKASADAQARTDREQLQTRLATISRVGNAWKLNQASQAADQKMTLQTQRAQAAGEAEVTRMKLENIARVGGAYKMMLASQAADVTQQLAAARSQAVADKQITDDRVNNIKAIGNVWKMMVPAIKADSKEIAAAEIRDAKESAAAQARLIDVLNARIKASNAAAVAARTANIGTTGKTLGGAEIVGSYTPYDALKRASKDYTQQVLMDEKEQLAAHNRNLGVLNARIKAANELATATQKAAEIAKRADIGNTGMRLGGNEVVGSYTPYNALRAGGLKGGEVSEEAKKATRAAEEASGAFKKLKIDGDDAHAAMRGLASGFNLLWLTWGNLAPLMAGAAISNLARKTFDIGSEVEYNLKFMEVLGMTTKETSSVIRAELRKIDQDTLFSLTELSAGMVQLGQAGLNSAESLQTIRASADLAAAGMTDLKTSTDLLIQVNAIYGRDSKDTARTAAQLFEITKSGVLNVENLGGSFKYASETNTRFGKSLEESLALLGSLAQAGIKNGSGGTALINFLRDLNIRSGVAGKAINELEGIVNKARASTEKPFKFTMFKTDGSQKDAVSAVKELQTELQKLRPEDADRILAKFGSDRGLRTWFAMLRDGTASLEKQIDVLNRVTPDALIMAAKGLMDTSKGAMDQLKGAFVGALDRVFEVNADGFKKFIIDIRNFLDSDAFVIGVNQLVVALKALYETVSYLWPVLETLFKVWAGYKIISFGTQAVTGFATALATVPAQVTAAATALKGYQTAASASGAASVAAAGAATGFAKTTAGANAVLSAAPAAVGGATMAFTGYRMAAVGAGAAASAAAVGTSAFAVAGGVAMRALAFLANPIVGLVLTLGSLGAAWYASRDAAKTSLDDTTTKVIENGNININQIQKEINKLNELRGLHKQTDVYQPIVEAIDQSNNDIARKQLRQSQLTEIINDQNKSAQVVKQAQNEFKANNDKIVEMVENRNEALSRLNKQRFNDDRRDASAAFEKAQKEEAERARLTGTLTGDPKGPKGPFGGKPQVDFGEFKVANDNILRETQKGADSQLAIYKNLYDNEKSLMDAKHSAKLISEGTYQAQVIASTKRFENESIATLKATNLVLEAEYNEHAAEIQTALDKANKAQNTGAITSLEGALKNLKQTKTQLVQTNLDKITQIETTAMTRMELATIAADGAIKKLEEDSKVYWSKNDAEIEKAKALDLVNEKYSNMNTSILSNDVAAKAADEARVSELAKHTVMMDGLTESINKAEQARLDYAIAALESGALLEEEGQNELDRLDAQLEKLKQMRNLAGGRANSSADTAAANAADKASKQQMSEFKGSLANAAETALFEGGKAGAKKLRDVLQEELLRKPLRVILNGAMNAVFGDGSSGGGGGGFNIGSLLSGVGKFLGGNNLPSSATPGSDDFIGPPAPAGSGVTGQLGQLSNIASMGQTAYNLYNGTGPLAAAWKGVSTWASSLTSATTAAATTASSLAGTAGVVATPVYTATAVGTALPSMGAMAGASTAAGAGTAAGGAAAGAAANPGMFLGMGPAGWVMLIMMAIANAFGMFRKKSIIGAGLQGTLGDGSKLTAWEEHKKGGTLFSGSSFETKDPLANYKNLRKRDLEIIEELKAQGKGADGTLTYTGSPYGSGMAASTITGGGTSQYSEDMEEMAWRVEGQSNAINKMYESTRGNVVKMANGLGLFGDKVKNFTFTLDQQDLNFMDLDEDEIQEKLTAAMGKAGTAMAKDLLGTWVTETVDVVKKTQLTQRTTDQEETYLIEIEQVQHTRYVASEFAKAGETALETLTRLYGSFIAVQDAADALGFGVLEASLGVAAAADKMVEAFGGLEAFMQTTSSYISAYYSQSEQNEALAGRASRQLKTIGIDITPEAILGLKPDQIKDYVKSVTGVIKDEDLSELMKIATMIRPIYGDTGEAMQDTAQSAQSLGTAVEDLAQIFKDAIQALVDESKGLEVDLVRAMGNEPLARQMEKTNYMSQFTKLPAADQALLSSLYDYNQGLKDQIEVFNKLKELTDAINTSVSNIAGSFFGEQFGQDFQYQGVAANLSKAGLSGDVGGIALALQNMSKADIGTAAAYIMALPGVSTESKAALLSAVETLGSLKDANIELLKSEKSRLEGLRDSAKSLSNTIGKDLGLSNNRESELWDVVNGSGSLEDRIEAANELYGVIKETAAAEQEAAQTALDNAQALLDFGKSLLDYVKSLKTSELSSLTPAQKLAEAASQYSTTLALAQGGDKDAQGKLQDVTGKYLELAQKFDPEAYATIFTTVTTALESLGQGLVDTNGPIVAAQQAIIDLAGDANGLSAEQISKLTTLKASVDGMGTEANRLLTSIDAQLVKATEGLDLLPAKMAAILAGKDPAMVKPNQGTGTGTGMGQSSYTSYNDVFTSKTGVKYRGADLGAGAIAMVEAGKAMEMYNMAVEHGITSGMLAQWTGTSQQSLLDWAASMGLAAFDVGTNFVPQDMLAVVHKGETIRPAKYDPSKDGSNETMGLMLDELRMMNARIESLELTIAEGDQANYSATRTGSERVAECVENGMSMKAREAKLEKLRT